MYRNRSQVRDEKIRIYVNPTEKDEIQSAADDAGYERATFIREASLAAARFIKAQKIKQGALKNLEARLLSSEQVNFLLA